jgi:sugar lactone lactonase YvrE
MGLALALLAGGSASGAAAAALDYPLAVAASESGAIYLADRNLPGIWVVENGVLRLLFEGSKRFRTPLNAPRCLALDKDGALLAGDSATREVYRINAGGQAEPLVRSGTGIGIPMGIAVTNSGDLLVSDLETHYIWKVPHAGGEAAMWVQIPAPRGVCIDGEGNLWVVSHGKDQLVKVSPEGAVEPVVKGRPFEFPHTVVLDEAGAAYVADGYAKAVWKVPAGGEPVKWAEGQGLDNPVGLAWLGKQLLICDPRAQAVFQADAEGKLTRLEFKTP